MAEDNFNLRPDEAKVLQKLLTQMGVSSGVLRSNFNSTSQAIKEATSNAEKKRVILEKIKDYKR